MNPASAPSGRAPLPAQLLRQPTLRPLRPAVRKVLLVCGIVSSLLYGATNVVGSMRFEGYSSTSQTFSELLTIEFGATNFGKRFRLYSMATILLLVVGARWQAWTFPGLARTCRRRGWG